MLELLAVAILSSCLAGAATAAADRWGHEVAGVLSAFPLIVGPVLLLGARRHGAEFAAEAAAATLLGLAALSGFAVAYARRAARAGWLASLAAGWCAAAVLGVAAGRVSVGVAVALATALASIAVARLGLPPAGAGEHPPLPRWELPLRMAVTALLIVALTAAGSAFGPVAAGVLAALPTLASVLAVFTHARHGATAVTGLLRGMVAGMVAFAAFCAVVGLLVEHDVALAFVLATTCAAAIQLASGLRRRPGHALP